MIYTIKVLFNRHAGYKWFVQVLVVAKAGIEMWIWRGINALDLICTKCLKIRYTIINNTFRPTSALKNPEIPKR